jgi:hypothetical protein
MSDETKAIEETAKAAQELAKTSSKAIDATPLPTLGYPLLVLTFVGWIWTLLRG